MKKIIDFCKEKYKILIPVIVVLVLLIAVYYLYREYRYNNYRNKVEIPVYQYFGGVKNDYTAIISYNLKKDIVAIEGKDKKINYDATPIYLKNEDKVIFPSEMSAVFPLKDGVQYRLYKYTIYENIDNNYHLTSGKNSGSYNNFFIFDGEGLYFFPDEVTLKVNNKELVKLSANSYAEVVGGYTLTYYNKDKDEAKVLEIEGKEVTASNNYLDLSLNNRYFKVYDKKVLLVPSYNLEALLSN